MASMDAPDKTLGDIITNMSMVVTIDNALALCNIIPCLATMDALHMSLGEIMSTIETIDVIATWQRLWRNTTLGDIMA